MNMQTIQILLLLLDGIVKLAPWRIVTETMDRIGYGASESLARSFGAIAVCAGLCVFPPIPMLGAILLNGYLAVTAWDEFWLRNGRRRGVNAAAGLICLADSDRQEASRV